MNAGVKPTAEDNGRNASPDVRGEVPRLWLPVKPNEVVRTVILFAIVVFFFGMALDFFLVNQGRIRPLAAASILNGCFSLVASFLLYKVLMHDRKERVRVIERLATIDEMNHHIRNALQIISFNAHGESSETELAEIRQAVARIQWSLNEILPKVEPEFAPFDRSAAHGQYEDPEDHG